MEAPFSNDIMMKSADLIKKDCLDYGGFGKVYLCYHKTQGYVVLKKVYTGPLRDEQKLSLIEEGRLMNKLDHKRIVKLLGVILEDGDYSLVMELIPKGNLLVMLQKVDVPISIQGRFILEILEGMVYLAQKKVIHKDLKPENILVDDSFHIKIADLGLATCQAWSRLTREESRRKSFSKTCVGMAGTLYYMAPEHLKDINNPPTEKSDVYSFGIVIWVILTSKEPYKNAINQDHVCQCVSQGNRPDDAVIPSGAPQMIISLMKQCWDQEPVERPTFQESYDSFLPFYKKNLEKDVDKDLGGVVDSYKGPSELVDEMKSLTTEQEVAQQDPDALHSSDLPATLRTSNGMPVEASLEDFGFPPSESLQMDAVPSENAVPADPYTAANPLIPANPAILEQKLEQELNYHKYGSYAPEQSNHHSPSSSNPALQTVANQRRSGDVRYPTSSVQSWTKSSPDRNTAEESRPPAAASSPYDTPYMPEYQSHMSLPNSQYSQYHQQKAHYDRMQSWPDVNSEYQAAFAPSCSGPLSDRGSVYITQASGIQIGSNNVMNIQHQPSSPLSFPSNASSSHKYKQLFVKYEDHAITDNHLELVRQNVGSKWKSCARKLGLTDVEIETIEHDFARDGLAEKVHQMLERWKMKEGLHGCTVGKLCRGLEDIVKPEVLLKLLLKSQDDTVPSARETF